MSGNDSYQDLGACLAAAGASDEPDEVHGCLCGMLCVNVDVALSELVDAPPDAGLEDALTALRTLTVDRLYDPGCTFTPLLPEDAAPLSERVAALARWCSGFVYGLASRRQFDLDAVSQEVREVVHDLTELSKAGISEQDPQDEGAEADYAELMEYVRVGVQLIFLELRPDRPEPAARLH